MEQTTYTYSIAGDCLNGITNTDKLLIIIQASAIAVAIVEVDTDGDVLSIVFEDVLSPSDKTLLDGIVATADSSADIQHEYRALGSRQSIDLNTTQDQLIIIPTDWYVIRSIFCCKPSVGISNAIGGIYTGPNKTGIQLVSEDQSYAALSTTMKYMDLELNPDLMVDINNSKILYFSLSTPEGSAATMDIVVYGQDLTE